MNFEPEIVVQHKENLDGNIHVVVFNEKTEESMLVKDFGHALILGESLKFAEKLAKVLGCNCVRLREARTWRELR